MAAIIRLSEPQYEHIEDYPLLKKRGILLERVLEAQRQLLTIRENELKKLRQQVEDMKQLLQTVTIEWSIQVPANISLKTEPARIESWSDRADRFAPMRSQILEAAKLLAKTRNEPLHQSEIIAEARRRNPYLKTVDESTLTARIREMCEPMGLLNRIKPGYYFPSRKAILEVKLDG